jgi:hypothetical protein
MESGVQNKHQVSLMDTPCLFWTLLLLLSYQEHDLCASACRLRGKDLGKGISQITPYLLRHQ